MRTAIQAVLILGILVLTYLLYESIMKPIRFNQERDERYGKTISRLKDIRTAQVAFKAENGLYTADFDSLITFIKSGNFRVVVKIGSLSDSLIEAGWNEKKALKAGIIKRDTLLVPIRDSLFGKNYPIDSLKYVPFTKGEVFKLGTAVIETGSKVRVNVFEASVLNSVLLDGLDKQLVINFSDERKKLTGFAGLKVGSLEEATNNAGNWE
ncbi:MAG: hypothetical protein U0T82_07090 [Bacteroidales bacterium]